MTCTLGIIGSGHLSEEANALLLDDVVSSAIQAGHQQVIVLYVAAEMSETVTFAIQHLTATCSIEPRFHLDEVVRGVGEAYQDGKLLVYWDDSPETSLAVLKALSNNTEVRDLCALYARIETINKENNNVADVDTGAPEDGAVEYWSFETLAEQTEEELATIAEGFTADGFPVDVTEYATWDVVRDAILAAQDAWLVSQGEEPIYDTTTSGDPEEPPEEPKSGPPGKTLEEANGAVDPLTKYTAAELMEISEKADGMRRLKDICAYNKIEVPGQRPHKPTYIESILKFQEEHGGIGAPAAKAKRATREVAPTAPVSAQSLPSDDWQQLQPVSQFDTGGIEAGLRGLSTALAAEVEKLRGSLSSDIAALTATLIELNATLWNGFQEKLEAPVAPAAPPARPTPSGIRRPLPGTRPN